MNQNIEKLYAIAQKKTRRIIGLMSGTSLDGLDVALCEISGSGKKTKLSMIAFDTIKYEEDFILEIKEIFSRKQVDLQKVCLLNEWIGIRHAAMINAFLNNRGYAKDDVDLIASHGQTIYHAPQQLHKQLNFPNGTLQIGDGDHLAVKTGIITISDFRQKHIAAGGEGAPLAAYGDFILFSEDNHDIILLNIGGISNFTYIPSGSAFNEIICTDCGPGNTIMDAWMQKKYTGIFFDEGAQIALKGKVLQNLLSALKEHPFFDYAFSKTTGPELFNLKYLEDAMTKCGITSTRPEDIMATLNFFTADVICDAVEKISANNKKIKMYASGGGIHNPLLMQTISERLNQMTIQTTAGKLINPDAKEAVLFAILANECVAANHRDFGKGTEYFPAISMGKISFPQ